MFDHLSLTVYSEIYNAWSRIMQYTIASMHTDATRASWPEGKISPWVLLSPPSTVAESRFETEAVARVTTSTNAWTGYQANDHLNCGQRQRAEPKQEPMRNRSDAMKSGAAGNLT